MIPLSDLECRYTMLVRPRPQLPTIGFVWIVKSTGEVLARGSGFATQQGMREAREVAYRNITQRAPTWSLSQYPEAA